MPPHCRDQLQALRVGSANDKYMPFTRPPCGSPGPTRLKEFHMVTYLYWFIVIALIVGALYLFGVKAANWRLAGIVSVVVLIVGWALFHFYFENVFVKRWGGKMTIDVPEGMHHISATWKDDHLWIENYDPKTNRCIFQEYSRGTVLEGKVIMKNCNPLRTQAP
jgi:hypothetical protein